MMSRSCSTTEEDERCEIDTSYNTCYVMKSVMSIMLWEPHVLVSGNW